MAAMLSGKVPGAAQALPAAGVVPPSLTVDVTGAPDAAPAFLEAQIRDAIDRAIRPTLRPGAAIVAGSFVPWPLPELAPGARMAVNVSIAITSDASSAPVIATAGIVLENVALPPFVPAALFLSDDPEYLNGDGVAFRGSVGPQQPHRLYYYHSGAGLPRDLDVVLTATVPSKVHIVASKADPDLDVMSVGHTASRDFLFAQRANEGIVVDIEPGTPFVLRHALLLQGEVAAGVADVRVLAGAVDIAVVALPAGGNLAAYLNAPRLAFDGHFRHGTFDLDGFGPIAGTYTVGGPDAAVRYGGRTQTPRNLDPADRGRDYGDYGIVHRITFTLVNPTDDPHLVYLYAKPLGGPVQGSFLVDGQFKELRCVRVPQPYWMTTYQLAPRSTGASTTFTMPDGGSFYPLELGVTETPPQPYTPPLDAPDGCHGSAGAAPQSTGAAN